MSTATLASPGATATPLNLEASDVTGTHSILARDVQPTLSAGDVARSLAAVMLLPENVPWTLRDEGTSAFLDDARPIGEQVEPGGAGYHYAQSAPGHEG